MAPGTVAEFLTEWGYQAYLFLFLLTPLGSPITEDLLLLVGGYLVAEGVFSWSVALPLASVAMVITDVVLYGFGRYLRTHTSRRGRLSRLVRPARIRQATRWFARYGDAAVFVCRLVPGTRLICFVGAGMSGVRLSRFALYDVLGIVILAPLLLWVGYRLHDRLGNLADVLRWIESRAAWILVVALIAVAARQYWLRHVKRPSA